MTDLTGAGEDAAITFNVKSSSGPKISVSVPLSTTVADLKTKLAEPGMANVPVASQRLIYSGKVLKDVETLETYKVKEGNTIHLVRTAASNERQNPVSQSSAPTSSTTTNPTPSAVPQNFAAGTGNDPLAGLTGARYAGFHGLPSLESLANPPSPDEMIRRLNDPNFAQQMNEALQNPQLIDMMINQNPQLRAMGPQARQMLQSERFRNMMTNPEHMRAMLEMQRAMGQDPFGSLGGQEAFPMPGATNTTDQQHQDQNQTQNQTPGQQQNQQNPFASLFGGAGAGAGGGINPFMFMPPPPQNQDRSAGAATGSQPANPFAALFNPALGQQQTPSGQPGQTGANTDTSANQGAAAQQDAFANMLNNPMLQNLMNNPDAMRNAVQMLQGSGIDPYAMFGGGAGAGFGSLAPADNRPPEERYSTQLRQLNEMGFYSFEQNIQALTRSGGDVNGALEWLFSQPPS